jgi:hypothetical protein
MLEKVPGSLPCGTGFASLLSFHDGRCSFYGGRCRWGIPSSTPSIADEFQPCV